MKKILKRILLILCLSLLVSLSIFMIKNLGETDGDVKVESITLNETSIVF